MTYLYMAINLLLYEVNIYMRITFFWWWYEDHFIEIVARSKFIETNTQF